MDNVSVTSQLETTVPGNLETVRSTAGNSTAALRWGAMTLGLIVIATVFGNILLCLAVITERRLQNMTNYFLVSLAAPHAA